MLLPALFAAAVAAPPPSLDLAELDDPKLWQTRSRALLDGPGGCIEVQGRVRLQFSLYTPGGFFSAGERKDIVGQGVFEGRLDQGVWTRLNTTWDHGAPTEGDAAAGPKNTLETNRFVPIVGRLPAQAKPKVGAKPKPAQASATTSDGDTETITLQDDSDAGSISISAGSGGMQVQIADGGEAALGMLDQVLQDIDPEGTSLFVVWEDPSQTVVLTEGVPLDQGGDLQIDVRFPGGGAPTRLDAVFPSKVRFREDGVAFTVRDAQLHLRGREVEGLGVVPGIEGMSLVMGVFGFTAGVDQRVSYDRVRGCPR